MIPVLDWIFEGVTNWVASVVSELMDAVSGLFLNALGTDMTAMEEYFPFISKAYDVLQYTSWAILLLIVGWQLFRVFGGPITEAENPWHLLVRAALAAFLIGYAKPIFVLILDITTAPYTALMDLSMTGEDFTFAGVEQALQNGLTTMVSVASIVGVLLLLILEIAIGWNYFKLLLETVERYVVVGVLCYTAPLAFCMAGSKATSQVFKSWCRMVGSQMILLVLNVWFLRGFASSMGHFIGNGGALTNGNGSVFLWAFCALAYLKCAQRFDSYLSSIGMSVAQTGSSMGMELVMAARAITGATGSVGKGSGGVIQRGINSLFGNGAPTATGTGAAAAGFASAFTSKFKPNTYVRDAVVEGGTRAGVSGGAGFVARAFGGIAARNGTALTGGSISTVASRTPNMSGIIGGDIANRSLGNYMPQLSGFQLKDTQIAGGQISTTAISADGKKTAVQMFSASQYEKPNAPHRLVTASDGSQWYQMASGEDRNAFYGVQKFSGAPEEAAQVAATFPDVPEGTSLRTVGEGILEANTPDGNALWYNSAFFEEPDAPYSAIQSSDGVEWYAMKPHAEAPAFDGTDGQQVAEPAGMGDGLLQNTESQNAFGEISGANHQVGLADGQFQDAPVSDLSNSGYVVGTDQMDQIVQPMGVLCGGVESGNVSDTVQQAAAEADNGGSQFVVPDDMNLPVGVPPIGNDGFTEPAIQQNANGVGIPQDGLYQDVPDMERQDASVPAFTGGQPDVPAQAVETPLGGTELQTGTVQAGSEVYQDMPVQNGEVPAYGASNHGQYPGDHEVQHDYGFVEHPRYYDGTENDAQADIPLQQNPSVGHQRIAPPAGQVQTGSNHVEAPQIVPDNPEAQAMYNKAVFQAFIPGYDQSVSQVDGSQRGEGRIDIRHEDGSGVAFFDTTRYAPPRGDYRVYEDAKGGQWYAIRGDAAVDRKPVYEDGKPVYDGDKLRTVNVETVRYKNVPAKFSSPKPRQKMEPQKPKRKN